MAVTTTLKLQFDVTSNKSLDLSTPKDVLALLHEFSWADGTGANQADLAWWDRRTVNSASNDDIDLSGVVTDGFGDTIALARVRFLAILNRHASLTITAGPASSNGWSTWINGTTPTVNIPPATTVNSVVRPGTFVLVAPDATGYAVTAGTGDILRIANAGGSNVDYDIVVLGASA